MNIATALNRKYIGYTYVMITSFLENNRDEHNTVYLLNHELTKEDEEKFITDFQNYDADIVFLKINREIFTDQFPVTQVWSMETYYRLFLMDILPESVERILYLDVDMIINQSVKDFYYSDFGGKLLKVCKNAGGYLDQNERLNNKQKEMLHDMLEKGFEYFNAGMLLMNIADLRKKYCFQSYLDAIYEWNFEMGAPDQDILNYLHWNQIEYVDAKKYNYFSRIAHEQGIDYERGKKELCIIHYTDEKPWETKNYHYPIEQIWWDYAKLTPFYTELLESFLEKTMFDSTIEDWLRDLTNQVNDVQSKFQESLELVQKLLAMIEQ